MTCSEYSSMKYETFYALSHEIPGTCTVVYSEYLGQF